MSVDIDAYCSNPSKYTGLPQNTRDYYDDICQLRSSLSSMGSTIKNMDWRGIGLAIPEGMINMLQGIFSPEGLKMISIFVGVDMTGKFGMNGILRVIASGLGPEVMKEAGEIADKEGAFFANNAIMSTVLSKAVQEGSIEASALTIAKVAMDMAETASGVLIIVQLLTAVLDTWDPKGFNNALNGGKMIENNMSMNNAFITQTLSNITVGKDEFGNPVNTVTWPVEFYADKMISGEKADEYELKLFRYQVEYKKSLTVNSNGDPIAWSKDPNVPLINPGHFDQLASRFSNILANKNSVIANWIDRFLPIIIILLVIGVFIFVFFIK